MHVPSANPVIRKAISDYMIKETYHEMETCYDTDNVVYKVFGIDDEASNTKEFRFCYKGNATAKIMECGGKDMLEELYKDYLLPESEWDPDFDLTLRIDPGNLPKTQKVKKSMDEETQERVRDENEKVRHQRKDMVTPVAELVSKFKMNFASAPIRRAMNAAL